jgi:NAD+ kinase
VTGDLDGVRRIGLVTHGGKQVARDAAERVRSWAAGRGLACVDVDVWGPEGGARHCAADEAERAGRPDLVVTVGGDGTFLRGAGVAAASGGLVLGVDVGRVGFLTEVHVEQVEQALEAVVEGDVVLDPRMMLTMRASRPLEVPPGIEALLRYGRGAAVPPPPVREGTPGELGWGVPLDVLALNDVVFEKLARDRQASIGVYVDARLFASYSADALVVSSPTGSTAYSFAAGGPVLSPRVDAIVFTPVAPHMIFDRSLVLAVDEMVAVGVLEHSGQVAVSVDGQLRGVLDPGDWMAVYGGRRRARLVRLRPSDFFGRLRARFGLADAAAAAADGSPPLVYQPDGPRPAEMRHLYLAPRDDDESR